MLAGTKSGRRRKGARNLDILGISEKVVFLLANLDGASTVLRDEDFVTSLDAHEDALAILVKGAGSDGQDVGLVEFLDARFGQEDAPGSASFGLDSLHQDSIEQRHKRFDGLKGSRLEMREEVISETWP